MNSTRSIGNDIVDLEDPDSDVSGLHHRYMDRVFTAAEQLRINSSRDPATTLWAHWAAKESAFKAVSRITPSIRFVPRKFVAVLADQLPKTSWGCVHHQGLAVAVELHRTRKWLHVIACLTSSGLAAEPIHGVAKLLANEERSAAARSLACSQLAPRLGCSSDQLEITGSQPPLVLLDGSPTTSVVSLSHHGRWIAYAGLPQTK